MTTQGIGINEIAKKLAIMKLFARFVNNQWSTVPQMSVMGGYRCAQAETVISWGVQNTLRVVAAIIGASQPIEIVI